MWRCQLCYITLTYVRWQHRQSYYESSRDLVTIAQVTSFIEEYYVALNATWMQLMLLFDIISWNFFWVWCNRSNELLFIKFFFSFHFILSCWLPLWFVSRKFTIEIQFMESYSNFENSTIYIFFFIQRFMKNMLYNQTENNFWWKSKLKKRSKIFSFRFLSILFLFKFKKFYSFFSSYINTSYMNNKIVFIYLIYLWMIKMLKWRNK